MKIPIMKPKFPVYQPEELVDGKMIAIAPASVLLTDGAGDHTGEITCKLHDDPDYSLSRELANKLAEFLRNKES